MSQTGARRPPSRAPASRERQRAAPGFVVIGVAVLSAVMGAIALPTFVVAMAGLLPSVVAFIVDDKPSRPLFHTVASLNLAGVAPFLLQLWSHGHTLDVALGIIMNVFNLATMYGAAAAGWALVWFSPIVALFVADVLSDVRLHRLEAREKELRAEWDFDDR